MRRLKMIADGMAVWCVVVAGTLGLAAAAMAADEPVTPERPGRPSAAENTATTQPAATTQPTATAPAPGTSGSASDKDFFDQTAADLGISPPEQRFDQMVLRWFGLRTIAAGAGIDFEGSVTADYSKNFMGGLDTNNDAFRHLLDLRVSLDTKAMFGWYGGTFSVDFQNQNGRNGSDLLTGDVQGFDNDDADGRTQVSELWYQQLFFVDKLRIKVGKVDANTEFAFPEYGTNFMNSSFGHSPTIITMPTYPDPAMSVNVFVYPFKWLYGGVGVYDGSGVDGIVTGQFGPAKFFDGPGHYFTIGETGIRWVLNEDTLPGRVAVGGWYSNGHFDRFDGTTQSGTGGMYAMLEQKIWHKMFYNKTDAQGIYAFLQYGQADQHVSEVTDYIGGGLSWTGAIPTRENDTTGVGFAYARLTPSGAAGFTDSYEMSIETFYGLQVSPNLLIKPDLQYIIHPGGMGLDDALVATLRVTVAF